MPYYKKVLQQKEAVRYIGKLHWIIYRRAIFWLFLAIAAFVSISVYHSSDTPAAVLCTSRASPQLQCWSCAFRCSPRASSL